MSIDGRGSSLSRAAQDTISALKSKLRRAEERIAVLELLVQSTSDDRDGYMEHVAERTAERDRARRIAVELEQQLAAIGSELVRLRETYRDPACAGAVDDCVDSFELITDILITDRAEDVLAELDGAE